MQQHTHAVVTQVWRTETSCRSYLVLYFHVGFRDWTQSTRFHGKHLYLLISLAKDNPVHRSKYYTFLHFFQVYYFLIVRVEHQKETYRWPSTIYTTRNRNQLCTVYPGGGSSNTKKSRGAPGPSLKSKEKESQYGRREGGRQRGGGYRYRYRYKSMAGPLPQSLKQKCLNQASLQTQ